MPLACTLWWVRGVWRKISSFLVLEPFEEEGLTDTVNAQNVPQLETIRNNNVRQSFWNRQVPRKFMSVVAWWSLDWTAMQAYRSLKIPLEQNLGYPAARIIAANFQSTSKESWRMELIYFLKTVKTSPRWMMRNMWLWTQLSIKTVNSLRTSYRGMAWSSDIWVFGGDTGHCQRQSTE